MKALGTVLGCQPMVLVSMENREDFFIYLMPPSTGKLPFSSATFGNPFSKFMSKRRSIMFFCFSCHQRNNLIIIYVGYESLTYNVVQQKSAYGVQDFFGKFNTWRKLHGKCARTIFIHEF